MLASINGAIAMKLSPSKSSGFRTSRAAKRCPTGITPTILAETRISASPCLRDCRPRSSCSKSITDPKSLKDAHVRRLE